MSYEPTNWKAGDTVTSAKLNKLEQGVANGGNNIVMMTMKENDNDTFTFTLNKTWQEIWDNRYTVICGETSDHSKIFYLIENIDAIAHSVYIFNHIDQTISHLQASSADSYPSYTISPPSE